MDSSKISSRTDSFLLEKYCMLYDANYDRDLVEERQMCKNICHEYNLVKPSDLERRREILRKLLVKTGKEFLIEQPFYCDYGYNIEIGENFYSNVNCVILDGAKVKFGDNVFVAPNSLAVGNPCRVIREI